MSNRRITTRERTLRAYRNAGSGPAIHSDGKGNVRRGQGRNNFPYPPFALGFMGGSMRRSILSLHADAERPRKTYGRGYTRESLDAMTRDGLRVVAKNLHLSGYGHLNKAALVKAILDA